ncbi:surfeit locus 1 family protein [Neorhizobium huautlense]|uniref:SURF1-like protein n=1 Tax=Neorhizobium huautlense TaxID=67774 RepID=A0ABT9PMZ7_9HYPH|nr:SURF1 family protein [Neorhizobium huautlense]MDP9835838.1 surfeit locus 1 family protein [Neorhizobium huautlense]
MSSENTKPAGKARIILFVAMLLVTAATTALGVWQVQRLIAKRELIARVDARVHAEPVAPPPASASVTAANDEYKHVRVEGTYLNDKESFVQAVTSHGPGFWVVTPLLTADGSHILINRGFVPADRRDPAKRAEGQVEGQTEVTGLLRMSEPGGGFLRENDAANDRWYSRDVTAIAAARGVSPTAAYFIDAEANQAATAAPVGGLTVIKFPNNHASYIFTWFALAIMSAAAAFYVLRGHWPFMKPKAKN